MKRTKEEALQTKNFILETAFKEFLINGFDETTIDKIAKASGNTRGAVYWHFKDKDDIFDHLVEQKDIESIAHFSTLVNSSISPYTKLEEFLKMNFPDIKKKKEMVNYIKMKCELYAYRAKNGDKRNVTGQVLAATAGFIREAIKVGEFKKDLDPMLTAQTILSLIQGTYLSRLILLKSDPSNYIDMETFKKPVFEYLKSLTIK